MPKWNRFTLLVSVLIAGLFVQLVLLGGVLQERRKQTVAMAMATPTRVLVPTYTSTPTHSPTPTPTFTPTSFPIFVIIYHSTPTPTPTSLPKPTSAATPIPSPTPTISQVVIQPQKYGFSFGIQIHMLDVGGEEEGKIVNAVHDLGMSWVKQQVEWVIYEPRRGDLEWGRLDNLVNQFAGKKILFSVTHAPQWARNPSGNSLFDYQAFANFLSEMAQRYKGRVHAYEIWNEQNMNRDEAGPLIPAASYVDMLCLAYEAIKAVDPEAVVVSGAPTPTGWDDGVVAIRDTRYLKQMYQTGRLNACSDAIGVHPSGFNNPPDKKLGYQDPEEPDFKGDISFFYRETMERYRKIMVDNGDGNKLLWPTEFGWASTPNPVTGYEYAANNTEEEKANYVIQAYEMARNWGFVGPMFLWNLNFSLVDPGSEKAAFAIVGPGWTRLPAYNAVKSIPK